MKQFVLVFSLAFLLIFISRHTAAQVSINNDGSQPDPSAMLDVKSNMKGFLPPRVALISLDVAAPVATPVAYGLLVFNTASSGLAPNNVIPGYYYWKGNRWVAVSTPQGVQAGEMLFWNGFSWVTIPKGLHGQQLFFCDGIPSWGGCYPKLTAAPITNVTFNSAVSGGEVTSDGGSPVVERGVCWSTNPGPTTLDNKTISGSGTGTFISNITGLTANTTYYVRAYAKNNAGTAYATNVDSTFATGAQIDAPIASLPFISVCPGSSVDIPVKVVSFTNIKTISLTLNYNSTVLAYTGTTNTSGFPGLSVNGSQSGTIIITGSGNQGITYPDSTVLVTIHFNYAGGSTSLAWFDNGPSCEYYNNELVLLNDAPITSFYKNGLISETTGVGTPVFDLGSTSSHCQGVQSVTYTATASNSTGLSYTLDPVSLNAGNTINTSTGIVTFLSTWTGTSTITANADGCGGPKTADHIVTINPLLPVSVSVTYTSNAICAGTSVTYTAVPVNGGTAPTYQWKVNGIPVGSGNETFTYAPANNDIVTCILISNAPCVSVNQATYSTPPMMVTALLPVSVYISPSANSICAGTYVTYNATVTNGGASPSYQWMVNGVHVGTSNAAFSYIPINNDTVTCRVTSNAFCVSGNPATSNEVIMNVDPLLPVSVSIVASANNVCAGTSVTFTATANNGGTSATYQWKVNESNIGGNQATFTYVPNNNDVVKCVLTSNETCTNGNPAISNLVSMIVFPVLPVSVTVLPSATAVCAGTLVTFTATTLNGGTSPAYQWMVNGSHTGTNSSSFAYIPADNDAITCILTSNVNCSSNNPDTSVSVSITVYPLQPVGISISATTSEVCAGTPVTFTAIPVNGGTNPAYQWKNNGIMIPGATSSSYSFAPANGNMITCELTSNEQCATGNPATSNALTMTVHPILPVSVTISASANPVCEGTTVTFTASPVNGGTAPAYQWSVNGGPVAGATNPTYDYVPSNGDMITCSLQSSEACVSGNPAAAAPVTMTVNPSQPVSVTVTESANPVCAGTAVMFTATPVNGGSNPGYQWKVNGANITGATNVTYTFAPANGNAIRCEVTSNATCATENPALSDAVTMTVNPLMPVSVTIAASSNPVCAGTSVSFTATPVNGGSNPGYQWNINGSNVQGATDVTYTYAPVNNDQIKCTVTSSEPCASGNPASSPVLSMTVHPILPVSVSVSASANPVCEGTTVTFTATPVNGGITPAYQWSVNGTPVQGATDPTYANIPSNGDIITCSLSSSETCVSGNPATATPITMTINPSQPVSVTVTASANPVCAGTAVTFTAIPVNGGSNPDYQWKINGANITGATNVTYTFTPANGNAISCEVTSNANCATQNPAVSDAVTMTVNPLMPVGVTIAASANMVCAGTSVTFTATPVNGGSNPGYQWNVNGNDVQGATDVTYTYVPVNNDQLKCTVTSSEPCASGNPAVSPVLTMTVHPILPVSVSVSTSANPVCEGTTVTYTATQVNGGITPAYQWSVNGTPVTGATNTTYAYIPLNGDMVTCSLQSSEACVSGNPATAIPITMTVNPSQPVSVTVTESANPVCAGTAVTFTATPVNGGSNPAYQWKVNGANITGATNVTYTFAPANGNEIRCEVISNATCATENPAVSDAVTMTVNPLMPVSVTIAASSNPVCAGTAVTFTATVVNGGSNPGYQWSVNDSDVPGATNITYAYAPGNNDRIKCTVTSSEPCASGNPAASPVLTMTVHPILQVGLSISASAYTVCEGTTVTFTATPVNGGTAPAYQWSVNGTPVSGATDPTYSYVPLNGDMIACSLQSSEVCVSANPTTTTPITLTVNPSEPVSVTVTASADPVCAGTAVTFTATPVNGGSNPLYQWNVNGLDVTGATNVTYTYVPVNNDAVKCRLTSNATCATLNPAFSNTLTMTVNPLLPVGVTISASASTVCAGTAVTFTATPVNGGLNPTYKWSVNGSDVPGATNATYTFAPVNNDQIKCTVTSSESCAIGNPAASPVLTLTVNPILPVSVSVSCSANPVCEGTTVTFTAIPVNGGITPEYQWSVNATPVTGATNPTYTYIPSNGDLITCSLLSSEACVSGNPATATAITMTVNPSEPVSVTVAVSANPVCAGTLVIFTATPVNGGSSPLYQWNVNGTDVPGATNVNYTHVPVNNDAVKCRLISNATCPTGNPANSNTVTMIVNPLLPVSVTIAVSSNPVCAGTSVTFTATPVNGGSSPLYQWRINGSTVPGATNATFTYAPVNNDQIQCTLTSSEPCATGNPSTSPVLTMTVNPVLQVGLSISASAYTVCQGTSVTFTATPVNGGTTPSYQWIVNGTPVPGATNASYTFIPAFGDAITCTLFSSETCVAGNPATPNPLTVVVNPSQPVSVTVTASAYVVCAGTSVLFAATPVNGGSNPLYQWNVNGTDVPGATNVTYTYIPVQSDALKCRLTSNATCPTGNPATSNTVTMTVNPLMPVSVTIAASANPVCAGTTVTFTATPVNGGTSPAYQWIVNGTDVPGATNVTFSYVPFNGDAVKCRLTSNVTCPTGNPATSNTVTMGVNPLMPVSITIVASANPVCAGTSVTFTATPVNGGPNPGYQWILNGTDIPGATNGTYTFTPANDNNISCRLTSNLTCPYGSPATSNVIIMVVNPLLPVSVSNSPSANPVCAGVSVTFTATPVNGGSNPTYQWIVNGTDVPGATNVTYTYVPGNGDAVKCRLTSNATCPTGTPATSNTVTMTVNPLMPVSVTIAASANPVCAGTSVTFTASPVNGGTIPAYQWIVNNVDVPGATIVTYSYIPINNDAVKCRMTSNITCPTGNPATSNTVTMGVNPLMPVSVSIVASANPVCAGTSVTFTATPVNGGASPAYQWMLNGTDIPGATNVTYTYTPANGNNISCRLISNLTCPSGNPATSNVIPMGVNPLLPVSVSVSPSANPVCAGTAVTFTATPVNGGSNPLYQWIVNGTDVPGATNITYTYVPVNGDAVKCRLTSNATCPTGNPATSITVPMIVNPLMPVSVSIVASANPVCAGTSVTFTATPVNGGISPAYQWIVNNIDVPGATNVTYTYVPANNDSVKCRLTSNITCPTGNPATSNTVVMGVNPLMPVGITIVPSANPVCAGTTVTFTATPVNGGTSPAYQWIVNNTDVPGATIVTYSYTPANNDAVKCRLTSNVTCPTGNPAISNTVTMTVNPLLPVSLTIAASSNPVCAGTSVTFTATPFNGGLNPAYQWIVNGADVQGATSGSYSYAPLNNDSIRCRLTSNAVCPTGNPAISNKVTMTVNQLLPVSVTISTPNTTVCAGTSVTFTATPVNGGANPAYQWNVNNSDVTGATNITYSYIPANSNAVKCRLTSNATCPTGNPATSNTVTMTVNPLIPVSITIVASANPVCAGTSVTYTATPVNGGSSPGYQWKVNGTDVPGETNVTYTYIPSNNNAVTCVLTSSLTCPSGNPATSNVIAMTVNPLMPVNVTIAASANPVCAGTSVTFTATPVNGGTNPAYQWIVGGVGVSGATNATYSYVPSNNDNVKCRLLSNLNCASNNPDTSVAIVMTVNPLLTVSVTANASVNPVCSGTQVTFTAIPVNGGTTPAYQWVVNGANISGATNVTYAYVPVDGDQVKVILTSNVGCATANPATSAVISMSVITGVPVSVSITPSIYAVMPGTQVTFTATPVNGGTSPTYQWKVNGAVVGTNSNTYAYAPGNNDKITCVLTSNLTGCTTGNPATSNQVVMIVYVTGSPCTGIATVSYGTLTYNTVQIGTQCWLRENLNIGTMIQGTTEQSNNSVLEKYCYNNLEANCNVYGGQYQWAEMVQYLNNATNTTNWSPVPTGNVQGICPTGWHIPTNGEWGTLMTYLGGIAVTGGKLKQVGTNHFNSPNTGATNTSGFTSIPAGQRWSDGTSHYMNMSTGYWTITSGGAGTDIYYGGTSYSINAATNGQFFKVTGISVRCLKD